MKRIVNYRVYDTDKDKSLGGWNNGKPRDADAYYEETLYVTSTGGYYLHMVGGPSSPAMLGWGGRADFGVAPMGELIEPLTNELAWKWGKKHLPNPMPDMEPQCSKSSKSLYQETRD